MEDRKYNVKVLEKLLRILELFTPVDNSFTLDQVTRKSGLSKSTVFRILKTMESAGFFRYDAPTETYGLGLRFLELGSIVCDSVAPDEKTNRKKSRS